MSYETLFGTITPDQIFTGNIKMCTKCIEHSNLCGSHLGSTPFFYDGVGYYEVESEIYKENAILIKIKNGGYVDIDNINSIIDYIKIKKDILGEGRWRLGGLMMSTMTSTTYCQLFVDKETLKPYNPEKLSDYYLNPQTPKIPVRRLKKQIQAQKNN